MPKIIIDGKEIDFKQGQTIIEAAKDHGIEIPHFCWHPKLSVSGNCRMCLVEVEKMPKLVIACATVASDGMVVHTESPKAIAARNAVMEFLLINHPLDCPICDEAGECKLQDYAYQHSIGESRFVEEKVHKDKRVKIGPRVMFDAERCISCSRCIRFCDEIAKDSELTFTKRGDRVTITTFPGEELDNPYSMNVVDICPVGALTNADFRFKARVWDMSHTNSVCIGCARGCNIEIWVRNNEILRLTPRHNEEVNSYWMCDHGRLNTFKFVNADTRVDSPHIRKDGKLSRVSWDEAFAEAASRLKTFTKDQIAVIGSPYATCEDNYIVSKFTKNVLGTNNIDFIRHIDYSFADDILRREDLTPNSLGAEFVGVKPQKNGLNIDGIIKSIKDGKIKALYLIEDDILTADAELEPHLAKLELLIVHTTNFNNSTNFADIVFPAATYAEKNGTFINFQGRLQRIRPAVATIEVDRALEGMALSRLDRFGTKFDRWAQGKHFDARATWKILTSLANVLGSKWKYQMAEDVFDEMTSSIAEFRGLDYDVIGDLGVQLKLEKVNVV
ncbi:NADH dehydrogenase I subunit G [Ignavibacterium album JCM 16511]|uniref:NADH dehydrogenase I subunit G n=1 Tax=Ignavibacterium album (strain DSM 19864 / JCM 16511 / NBRC 101810 / Mat9-16) TaxID=945713 RepID=I0AHZ8_IGNAJ|nr:molybdopterin-dependent oxidoreductase [Ignavibacterium album]AFH48605.1 NADH dehydrogenase I subunit G [Ignavibacterium album JCM 16511]